MRSKFARALALSCGAMLSGCATVAATDCDRNCLSGIRDTYLASMVTNQVGQVPLTAGYRATEDGREVRLGEGLWKTATGLGDYRIDFADPVSGNVGTIVQVMEGDNPVTLALRLKVIDRRISEIESILGRARVPGTTVRELARPMLSRPAPKSERLTRAQMIALANDNFDAIMANRGDIYASDCQRIENRMAMSGDPQLDYPIGAVPGKPKPRFGNMGCAEQIEAHLFETLDEIGPRRFLLLDEEKQLVFGVYMLRFYKLGKCNEIPGYGRICHDPPRKPTALMSAEVLGVRGGKIHEVEVVFRYADYDEDSGWQGDLRSPRD